ncbi:MAG: DedA family protein [Ilumatobacteraceae bacterium]
MFAGIITDVTNRLFDLSGIWWFLALILVIAFFDSVIPVVPSETLVIMGGIAASQHQYSVLLVILLGAVGAFLGDNTAYALGNLARPWFERRAEARPKFGKRLEWAKEQIAVRGGMLLITARFIPGGRTALTLSSGITRQPRRWFFGWITAAVLIWATYAAMLGYIGGKAAKDNHTAAFMIAFGTALGVNAVIELVRHFRKPKSAPV